MLGLSGKSCSILGLSAALLLTAAPQAGAQGVTEQQILKALSPPKMRSLSIGSPAKATPPPADAAFVDSVRNKDTHTVSMTERDKLTEVAAGKPKIDLTMEFDLNSDVLRGDALVTAHKLGKALSNPELKGQTFVIAGHTDAKGKDDLNQTLSERRADAVKRFLVKNYNIPAENLIGVGYGKTQLKNDGAPTARENRRVQTVNLLQVKTAER